MLRSSYLFRSRHHNHGGALRLIGNGTSANISTVLANGYGSDDVDVIGKEFYAGIVEVDGA